MTARPEPRPTRSGYLHDALFFGSDQDLLEATLEFALGALQRGEHLALACTDEHNALVADALDGFGAAGGPEGVTVLARDEVYLRPSAAIEGFRTLAHQVLAEGASGLRILGEVPASPGQAQQRQWGRFEAVCNHELADLPIWGLCAYDRRTAPTAVQENVLATHPTLRHGHERRLNPGYVAPEDFLAGLAHTAVLPVEATPPALELSGLGHDAVRHARERVRLALADHVRWTLPTTATSAERVDDAVLAVHELTDNAVRHGRPPVTIRMWATGPDVLVTVSDAGAGVADPFAGFVRHDTALGLWVTRQLCEELDLRHDGERFTVRLHLTLAG